MEKRLTGFAAMDPIRQRELASKGGKAAHQKGTAYKWNSETAKEAGKKGGEKSRGKIKENDNPPTE
jgi:hypothetical protein